LDCLVRQVAGFFFSVVAKFTQPVFCYDRTYWSQQICADIYTMPKAKLSSWLNQLWSLLKMVILGSLLILALLLYGIETDNFFSGNMSLTNIPMEIWSELCWTYQWKSDPNYAEHTNGNLIRIMLISTNLRFQVLFFITLFVSKYLTLHVTLSLYLFLEHSYSTLIRKGSFWKREV